MKKIECFRKLFFITSVAGIGILLNSCASGYVETEPTYVVINRPPQPSNVHVWIDGDWRWNNQSHGYVQRIGYWEKPRPSHTYVSGHWQSAPKGKYWQKGRWEKQNYSNNNKDKKKNHR
jgi:hypothetical protein